MKSTFLNKTATNNNQRPLQNPKLVPRLNQDLSTSYNIERVSRKRDSGGTQPSSIIPVVPDLYHTSLGEGNRGILDELRKITAKEMKRIYSKPEDQA
jgi:hypothetical protein